MTSMIANTTASLIESLGLVGLLLALVAIEALVIYRLDRRHEKQRVTWQQLQAADNRWKMEQIARQQEQALRAETKADSMMQVISRIEGKLTAR